MSGADAFLMAKTALVTGGSSGIGLELAKLLAGDNFNLVIVAKGKKGLKKVRDDLKDTYGIEITAIAADLSLADSPKKVYDEVKKQDIKLDILINCAGIGDFSEFVKSGPAKNAEMINLNCRALTSITRLFAGDMVKRKKGRIMNVASIAGFFPGPGMAVYFATKAYILHFTEALAEELRNSPVTVTCLCPGPTRTPFIEKASQEESGVIKPGLPAAEEVAEFGYLAMLNGRRVAVHGWKNKLQAFIARFLPRKTVAGLVRRVMEKDG